MKLFPARARLARIASVALVTTALVATTGLSAQAREVGDPFGYLDSVTAVDGGVKVRGWAWDPSRSWSTSVQVTAGPTTTTIKADKRRSDVGRAHPNAGNNRGFEDVIQVPAGTHRVCATAINEGWGRDKNLGCKTVTVQGGEAGPHNTGVPAGTKLTVHRGDIRVTKANTVIDGMDVRGFIDVRAPGVVIRNSIVRGDGDPNRTSYKALVTADRDNASVTIEDTELAPSVASPYVDGIRGYNITARRVNIHNVIDQVHVYGPNVTIENSWLHDNVHFANDPAWNGGSSHDDSIQVRAGKNIRIRNNTISGAKGSAIQFTQSMGKVSDVQITDNRIDGGGCSINFSEKDRGAFTGVAITDNTFGRNTANTDCAIIAPASTRDRLTVKANTYTDGKAVSVRRG